MSLGEGALVAVLRVYRLFRYSCTYATYPIFISSPFLASLKSRVDPSQRWTVQVAHRGVNSNHIQGMQWMSPSSPVRLLITQTLMYLQCKRSIITLVFLTNPFSTDMFLVIKQMQPCLSLSSTTNRYQRFRRFGSGWYLMHLHYSY